MNIMPLIVSPTKPGMCPKIQARPWASRYARPIIAKWKVRVSMFPENVVSVPIDSVSSSSRK